MGKKKRFFITKKNITWKKIDIIVLLIIFIIGIKDIIINIDGLIEQYSNYNHLSNWIFLTCMVIFSRILVVLPYLMIYFGIRYTIKKYNKSVVTFDVEQDLEYYREKFTGITPASMSLLMDLNLETDKDIGSMKLYYELNDIYMYERDGKTNIHNPKKVKLNKSDEILLKHFFDNDDKVTALKEWKENVICESINNNLIVRKSSKERKKVGCGVFLFLHILSFAYIIYVALNMEQYMNILDSIELDILTEQELFNIIMNNTDVLSCLIVLFIFVIAMLVYAWSIIGGIIHLVVSNIVSMKDKFKRTKEGNNLTEKLFGMKNFIHDFSNLDDASKEQLVLWDDFLIYAVVLEENDIILKEISDVYHIDLLKYKKY